MLRLWVEILLNELFEGKGLIHIYIYIYIPAKKNILIIKSNNKVHFIFLPLFYSDTVKIIFIFE